ncbi:PIN domain-containing protein [Bradyrhizobium zhanjiangense]|nr:PIN domain-containing protein [Bradyrhizobium zhanjiangense]
MLVDTCVWLDLAKTPAQSKNLDILLTLRSEELIDFIVPQIILDEFARNRDRVIAEYAKSVTTTLSKAREIVVQQGARKRSKALWRLFDQADNPIHTPRAIAEKAADQIETLLQAGDIIEVTDAMKLRASNRALQKQAPFHREKNSFADALLVEVYADYIKVHDKPRHRFAFVTHNIRDFSEPAGNHKLPHPDLAALFTKRKSRYCINVGDALGNMHLKGPLAWLYQSNDQAIRSVSDILQVVDELEKKIWYDRHMVSRQKIERGVEKLVPKLPDVPWPKRKNLIQQDIWDGALKSAAKVERRFGKENLGPWSKFDWGMMNGKLSALRWVLGEDWDMLDT